VTPSIVVENFRCLWGTCCYHLHGRRIYLQCEAWKKR